jgi:hypothetical protein
MRNLACTILLIGFCFSAASAQDAATGSGVKIGEDRSQWIEHVMHSISAIKPGMTRKSLSRMLIEDGGLQVRQHTRYLYKPCPYIKVEIEFAPADEGSTWSPDDKVISISRPYLEYPAAD